MVITKLAEIILFLNRANPKSILTTAILFIDQSWARKQIVHVYLMPKLCRMKSYELWGTWLIFRYQSSLWISPLHNSTLKGRDRSKFYLKTVKANLTNTFLNDEDVTFHLTTQSAFNSTTKKQDYWVIRHKKYFETSQSSKQSVDGALDIQVIRPSANKTNK